jgi:hypothetical protein
MRCHKSRTHQTNYVLTEDDQGLRSKHVEAISNKHNVEQDCIK